MSIASGGRVALGGGSATAVALALAVLVGAALGAALADGVALGASALVLFESPHEAARSAIIAERDAREVGRDGQESIAITSFAA